jgi:hypothetical protein
LEEVKNLERPGIGDILHSLTDLNQILLLQTELSLENVKKGDTTKCEPALCDIRDGLNRNAALLQDARQKVKETKF